MSERLERGVEALRGQLDSKVNAFFSSCVNCGICAESCLFYTETKDPRYTPIYKTEPLKKVWKAEKTFWGKLGLSKALTEEDLSEWESLVYEGCTSCGRCSMVCPLGIDVADMIYRVKQGLEASGYSPQDLVAAADRAIEFGSPMGDISHALRAHVKHVEEDTGLTVPFDIEGADYMVTISANEIVTYPDYVASLTHIFHQAGVSWTISSEAFQATNAGLQLGDNGIATELVKRIVDAAEKLKVKAVVSPECGHAYAAIRWNGPNYIGRSYNFKVLHILELLDELYRDGRLKTNGMDTSKLTFHDPCQLVRRGGLNAEPRELLGTIAENVIEMKEHGKMNWCCGGGGGVSAIESAADLRTTVFNRKKAQLDELNIDAVVTACSNCRTVLEDGLDANDMDLPVIGLTEMIAKYLVEDKDKLTKPSGENNNQSLLDTQISSSKNDIKSAIKPKEEDATNDVDKTISSVPESKPSSKQTASNLGAKNKKEQLEKKQLEKKQLEKKQADNLKKIEGIGPKIEELLHVAGIMTFSQLSKSSYDDLKAILNNAGSRYKMHNPKTWPQQAELADKGAWDELSELQDSLLGGRE
jgi:Fe-S oxidoreductase/predicted flap endonuclease-1-like 5' DNA nuclease